MSVQERRLEKGWSQERLAQVSGLSLRTVQRIESGKKPGYESLNCLAAVFETNVSNLMQEHKMTNAANTASHGTTPTDTLPLGKSREEAEEIDYVDNLKAFHLNWISFVIVMSGLYLLNIYVSPDVLWVIYPAVGWLFAIALHAVVIFGLFGVFNTDWEKRRIEKRRRHHM